MTEQKYWIWLSMALGAGARVDEILAAYPDISKIYSESRTERTISGVFTKSRLDRLESTKLSDAENAVKICRKNGWNIYTPESADYPEGLKNLPDRPLVLFSQGELSCIKKGIPIGVVGTRNPTYESTKITRKLCSDMSEKGAVIISGGALGIDSAAHEGALASGGVTVCVLGCGLGTRYLVSNETLRIEISKNGALVTEYPPFTEAGRTTFPLRNRIISGISCGVLVVEAGEKSGSLITARFATEQGREVFAVPGSILDTSHTGVNRLIRDGAKAVTCADDIISCYENLFPDRAVATEKKEPEVKIEKAKPVKQEKSAPASLEGNTLTVYKLLSKEPVHSDEICAMSGLSPAKVIAALTELEMLGYAEQTEGKNYILF